MKRILLLCTIALWTGEGYAVMSVMPHVFAGPMGDRSLYATSEVIVVNTSPDDEYRVWLTFSPRSGYIRHMWPQGFNLDDDNAIYLSRNEDFISAETTLPPGGSARLLFRAPQAESLIVGSFTASVLAPESVVEFEEESMVRAYGKSTVWYEDEDGNLEVQEEVTAVANQWGDFMGETSCLYITAPFSDGQFLSMAFSSSFDLTQEISASAHLRIREYDEHGNFLRPWPNWYLNKPYRFPEGTHGKTLVHLTAVFTGLGSGPDDSEAQFISPFIIGNRRSESHRSVQYSTMPTYYSCGIFLPEYRTSLEQRRAQAIQIRSGATRKESLKRLYRKQLDLVK